MTRTTAATALSDEERRRRRVIVNTAIAFWLILFMAATLFSFFRMWLPMERAKEAQMLPDQLGAVQLEESMDGPQAMAAIAKLHGKKIDLEKAYVGHYSGNQGSATLYISVSRSQSESRALYRLMTKRIGKANQIFTGLRKIAGPGGLEMYQAEGMGQEHFYYQKGTEVVWVAADPQIASAVVEEAAATIR